jgi:excisionase family DNA binding protein
MSELREVPTLDEVARDPARAATIPAEQRGAMIGLAAAAIAALSVPSVTPTAQAEQPGEPETDRLLTVPQAAELMGFAPSYVYEMARRGDLPSVHRKKYVRIRRSAIDKWIADNERFGVDRPSGAGPVGTRVARLRAAS